MHYSRGNGDEDSFLMMVGLKYIVGSNNSDNNMDKHEGAEWALDRCASLQHNFFLSWLMFRSGIRDVERRRRRWQSWRRKILQKKTKNIPVALLPTNNKHDIIAWATLQQAMLHSIALWNGREKKSGKTFSSILYPYNIHEHCYSQFPPAAPPPSRRRRRSSSIFYRRT